jgi:AraC-like DNA-binding protein/ligand-binding sensor protein
MESLINFKDIIELNIMINFCRLFSSITGMIIDINDMEGNHPKKYYTDNEVNEFCKIIQRSVSGKENCIRSGMERGIKAGILGKPDIHFCHAGLVDVYLPISIRGNHIATLSIGQFLTSKPTKKRFETIKKNIKDYEIDLKELEDAFMKTRVISKKNIINYTELINLIVSYIFEVEDKIIFLKSSNFSPIVSRGISYIEKNFQGKIYVKDVADFACVSKYYFEHIFKKETGVTFVDYLNVYRVSQAKQKLVERGISIVCFEAGFNSLSHFYKIFKRYTGTSPKGYKHNLQYLLNN